MVAEKQENFEGIKTNLRALIEKNELYNFFVTMEALAETKEFVVNTEILSDIRKQYLYGEDVENIKNIANTLIDSLQPLPINSHKSIFQNIAGVQGNANSTDIQGNTQEINYQAHNKQGNGDNGKGRISWANALTTLVPVILIVVVAVIGLSFLYILQLYDAQSPEKKLMRNELIVWKGKFEKLRDKLEEQGIEEKKEILRLIVGIEKDIAQYNQLKQDDIKRKTTSYKDSYAYFEQILLKSLRKQHDSLLSVSQGQDRRIQDLRSEQDSINKLIASEKNTNNTLKQRELALEKAKIESQILKQRIDSMQGTLEKIQSRLRKQEYNDAKQRDSLLRAFENILSKQDDIKRKMEQSEQDFLQKREELARLQKEMIAEGNIVCTYLVNPESKKEYEAILNNTNKQQTSKRVRYITVRCATKLGKEVVLHKVGSNESIARAKLQPTKNNLSEAKLSTILEKGQYEIRLITEEGNISQINKTFTFTIF